MFSSQRAIGLFVCSIVLLATSAAAQPIDSEFKVLGEMSGEEALSRLAGIGDFEDMQQLMKLNANTATATGQKIFSSPEQFNLQYASMEASSKKPYMHSTHVYGFVEPAGGTGGTFNIVSAATIKPDVSLRGKKIKIVLTKLRVFDYPGRSGFRKVLFDFSAQHQAAAATTSSQLLHFNQSYLVQEGEEAGIEGRPIFVGLKVGPEGVFFSGFTINVENQKDREMLAFLEGDSFRGGMELINTINPLVPIVSGFAQGIAKGILKKNENVGVQNFQLGLDFNPAPVGTKLREGTYLIVQAPLDWDWSKWVFNPTRHTFVSKADMTTPVPFNYIVITISKTFEQ